MLTLLLTASAVAQESPAPTMVFAPDDLTSALPSSNGEYDLRSVVLTTDQALSREFWLDLLLPYGKDPIDVRLGAGRWPVSSPLATRR